MSSSEAVMYKAELPLIPKAPSEQLARNTPAKIKQQVWSSLNITSPFHKTTFCSFLYHVEMLSNKITDDKWLP
tara:strand:+ start:895 stop:1113 length:219 start_codon:yes stop_codon:yes gene_type:complete